MVHIGFNKVPVCDLNTQTVIKITRKGSITFKGKAAIGHGSKLCIHGHLDLGSRFGISSNGTIYCYEEIRFGADCLVSWDVLVMDSDSHKVYNEDGTLPDIIKPIIIGNHVWLCYGVTVLKGTIIPDNCVVGTKSLVTGTRYQPNTVIIGIPAKSGKIIKDWKI